jgi:hypothetical protein
MEIQLNDLSKNGSVTIIVPDGEYKIKQNGSSIQITKSGKVVFSSAMSETTIQETNFFSNKTKTTAEGETFIKSEFADG